MPKLAPSQPLIHDGCQITASDFGAYCEVGRGSRLVQSSFADYAYCDQYADIANTSVGKFANIAAMTRIGPTDHPMANASLHHFLYRSSYYWDDIDDDASPAPPTRPSRRRAATTPTPGWTSPRARCRFRSFETRAVQPSRPRTTTSPCLRLGKWHRRLCEKR